MAARLKQVAVEALGEATQGALRATGCDRHVRRLTGANPVMAPGRGEHVGEGKGARRNSPRALRKRKLARPLLDGSQ
jgi:hypothetical protein